VAIGDRIVDAVADGGFIEAGSPVRVTTANAYRVTVKRRRGADNVTT